MKRFIPYSFLLLVFLTCSFHVGLAQGNINAMEYFIDNGDLGVGANPTIPITNGATITESFVIPTAALSEGFHTIYFRIQDIGGQWSMSESRGFYVSASNLSTQANIVNVEYFIDTDPGYGAGTSLGAFSSTSVTLNPTIPTSGLPTGFHVLYTRSLDSDGVWGNLESRSFYISKSDLTTTATVVEVRYFIDTDPGYGNGILIPITTGTTIDESTTISTSALLAGHHVLYIRSLDSDGVWSEMESRSFYVDAFSSGLITGIEYFYDTDPGFSNGSNFPIAPAVASIDQVVDLPTSALAAGTHELGLRMINENGVYGMTEYYSVTLCDVAVANFVPDVICLGSSTSFTETSTGVLAGDVYSWDFDGDAVEDSNTSGNQTFSFATAGTFNATLSINRAGCVNTIIVPVQVETLAASNAGADQDICIATTTLAALPLGANETGNWQLVNGTAAITTPTDPLSTLTGITTESVELSWTVTNTLGSCTSIDNVIINTSILLNADFIATSVCFGSATDFTDNSVNLLAGDSYSWDFDGDAIEDSNTAGNQSFSFATAGTFNATLSINRTGCINTITVPVQVEAAATSDAGIDQDICIADATLAALPLGSNETGIWQLINGAATITTPTDPLSTLTGITSESVELSWTVTNTLGTCTAVDNVIINTTTLLNADVTATSVCFGIATNFTDNSTNVLAGDTYSWDFEGDAIIDVTTTGNQSFIYATPGSYNANISITRGACVSSTTVLVDVFALPVIDAGIDQSICNQTTSLEGNIIGANETGSWQLISGSATISNSSDPQSTLDNITTNSVELSWTISNSVTTCTSVDNVIISVNLPITTTAVNETVDIGQSVIIDVLSGVTSNSGDVLTPTITVAPTDGTLEILANNTLNYIPNDNATDSDSFTFRVTNQCNNFSENDAQITITNQPPVIDNASFTAPIGNAPVEFDLTTLISDPNNNLDFSSLRIVTQPLSGALASIDAGGVLTIDYAGIAYSGDDHLQIEICDLVGVCTVQTIIIPNVDVGGENLPIKVFNAVSPNGDGYHDFLEIENIEFYPENTVIILNRWGNEVGRYKGYNNQDVVFNLTTLPAGTYYYHVLSGVDAVDPLTGFFLLKYDN